MEPWLIDPENRDEVERYLSDRGLLPARRLPIVVSRAGAGNMNLTLRVTGADGSSVIVKQGRPWVEKYAHIPAPFERTLVEAAFYRAVQRSSVAARMPALLHVDDVNHILVLEDLGAGGDYTPIYAGQPFDLAILADLLDWLAALGTLAIAAADEPWFQNRAMRALNHEHIFDLPLRRANGLDLDRITPGLSAIAGELVADSSYCAAVAALGRRYLAVGNRLVHGDFFPGSWLRRGASMCVIDPEFCFLGDPEFDYGVLAGHLILAERPASDLDAITAALATHALDLSLAAGYAGAEIMRRLIGVAQLPLQIDLARKRALLERSRRLVLESKRGLS